MSANMTNSANRPLWVDKWVVSWTQAFAMHICVVAPPGECLRVKADVVLFAGNTVWSISDSERISGVHEEALYKSMLPLPLKSWTRPCLWTLAKHQLMNTESNSSGHKTAENHLHVYSMAPYENARLRLSSWHHHVCRGTLPFLAGYAEECWQTSVYSYYAADVVGPSPDFNSYLTTTNRSHHRFVCKIRILFELCLGL